MDTEQSILLEQPKDRRDIHDYAFLVEKKAKDSQEPSMHRHELLGLPSLPFLGKYSGSAYEFGQVLSLVTTDVSFKKKGNDYGWMIDEEKGEGINLPDDVSQLLLNIPVYIDENKKEESEQSSNGAKGQKKGGKNNKKGSNQQKISNFFEVKDHLEDGKEEERVRQRDLIDDRHLSGEGKVFNKNPPAHQAAFIATERVKFSWIVQLNNIEVSDKLKNEPMLIVNYVMHTVLFPFINFERIKRMTARTPVGLIVPQEFGNRNGVREFEDSTRHQSKFFSGLRMGALRLEYSSVHLKGQSLCFSPNNMKLVVDKRVQIGLFWVVVLDETMQCNNCYLHWIINDAIFFGPIERICKDSKCLKDLFKGLDELLGKDNEVLSYTKSIFMA